MPPTDEKIAFLSCFLPIHEKSTLVKSKVNNDIKRVILGYLECATKLKEAEALGSIVFFNDGNNQAEHVGILTSIHNGAFWITHAVQGKYNCVIESVLQPGEYSIFTPTNIDLRLNILDSAREAACGKIDYDIPRIELLMQIEDEMPFCHPVTGLAAMYEFARISHEQNIWRRIKYFARKENGLVNNRGLMCSQFVCILIQNSEPGQEEVIDSTSANWVTDKHFLPHEEREDPASPMERGFREYQVRLRETTSTREYAQSHLEKKLPRKEVNPMWHNSYQIWKPKDELAPELFYRNSALPLDSKITSPKTMKYHMRRSPGHWGYEKPTAIPQPKKPVNEKQKIRWRGFCTIQAESQKEESNRLGNRRESPLHAERKLTPFEEARTEGKSPLHAERKLTPFEEARTEVKSPSHAERKLTPFEEARTEVKSPGIKLFASMELED